MQPPAPTPKATDSTAFGSGARGERRGAKTDREGSFRAAAAMIAKSVPDIPGLLSLLDHGGQRRLAAAIRCEIFEREPVAVVDGVPRADPAVWAAAADRVIGGGRR